jgi:hypothetical protein
MVKRKTSEVAVVKETTGDLIPREEIQGMIVSAVAQAMMPVLKELKEIKEGLRHPQAAVSESQWDEHDANFRQMNPSYNAKVRAARGG